jgi:hypothetical protein
MTATMSSFWTVLPWVAFNWLSMPGVPAVTVPSWLTVATVSPEDTSQLTSVLFVSRGSSVTFSFAVSPVFRLIEVLSRVILRSFFLL